MAFSSQTSIAALTRVACGGHIDQLRLTFIYFLFIYLFVSAIHVLTMTIHSKNVKMFKFHECLANARAYRLHPVAADSTPYTWLQLIKTIKGLKT